MKNQKKITSKKIIKLKGELGEMLKQFEKIKIDKSKKLKKSINLNKNTSLKKDSSFLKDDFMTDDFFKTKKTNVSIKEKKQSFSEKKQKENEQNDIIENNDTFIDIALDNEQSIIDSPIKPIMADNQNEAKEKLNDFILNLEVSFSEIKSEITILENNLLTNQKKSNPITKTNPAVSERTANKQEESYLIIKEQLTHIKNKISERSHDDNQISKTKNPNKIAINENKKAIENDVNTDIDNKLNSNIDTVDKLTIIILFLIVVILMILWIMFK